jgi:hypothetical protein
MMRYIEIVNQGTYYIKEPLTEDNQDTIEKFPFSDDPDYDKIGLLDEKGGPLPEGRKPIVLRFLIER